MSFALLVLIAIVLVANRDSLRKTLRGDQDRASAELDSVSDAVYAELDDLRTRVAEIEERQQFAERLLSEVKEAAKPEA
jgi:hypothetical protein